MAVDKGELDEALSKAERRKKSKRDRDGGQADVEGIDEGEEDGYEAVEEDPAPKRKRKRTPKAAAASAASTASEPGAPSNKGLKLTMKLGVRFVASSSSFFDTCPCTAPC
jgi:hypothetical protein